MPTTDTGDVRAARVSFVAMHEGYPHTIRRGSTYAADHPIVVGNPTRFGPVNVKEAPGTHGAAALQQAAERAPYQPPAPPPTVEELVARLVEDHTRDELNALATEAKVEAPEELANKAEVAAAIVAAHAAATPAEDSVDL